MSQPVTPPPSLPSDTTPPGQPGFPPAGGPGYPPPPAPQQGVSGLAITGLILAIFVPFVGFVLSLIAIFQTGPGKRRGRGLAITGVVLSVIIMATVGILVFTLSKSTIADPGCTAGKAAIVKASANQTPEGLNTAIADLNAAAAKAKDAKVRTAMKTLADDYAKLISDAKAGKAPEPGALDKIAADGQAIDDLCTVGS